MAARSWLQVGPTALVVVVAALALGAATANGATEAPVSTVPPIASGSPGVAKPLRVDTGSWNTSATFTYQWLRCDAYFEDCTDIAGAAAPTYTVVTADAGHVLAARVTATNAAGSAVAVSNGLGPVAARPPRPTQRPSIKGTKRVGQRLYEAGDRWTRSPYKFTILWLRCSAKGNACVRLTGKRLRCSGGSCLRVKTGREWDYRLTKRDVGHRLRVRVTAWNGAGHATATSSATRIVGN